MSILFNFCLGLSFLFPNFCISEAKLKLLETINFVNENIFNKKNLNLSYHQKCSTSWLQIDILDKEDVLLKRDKNSNDKENLSEKLTLTNQINFVKNQI